MKNDLTLSITGEVINISDEIYFGKLESRRKKSIVISIQDKDKIQFLPIDFLDDSVNYLNQIRIGDIVQCLIKVGGYKYTNRNEQIAYGSSLTGLGINKYV